MVLGILRKYIYVIVKIIEFIYLLQYIMYLENIKMEFSNEEIEELQTIREYLNTCDSEIATLGFNLYISKYLNKFDLIKNPRDDGFKYNSEARNYVCNYQYSSKYSNTYCLSYAIYLELKRSGYDINL